MLNPFGKGFNVTPKGTSSDRFSFNWQLALPLIIVFIASAFSLWINLGINLAIGMWQPDMSPVMAEKMKGFDLGLLWSIYNLLILGTSLLVLIDVPRPNLYEWFDLHRTVRLRIGEQPFWGTTSAISEVGAQVILTQAGFPTVLPGMKGQATAPSIPVELEILESELVLQGRATCTSVKDEQLTVRVMFEQVSLNQQRQLVEMLFCRWVSGRAAVLRENFRSLWLLFRIILRPRFVFDRNPEASVVAVSKV